MTRAVSASITRRSVVAGLTLAAAPVALLSGADNAYAQTKQTAPEKSLYERLGGVFAIAAVVDRFSDAVVKNPIVGRKSKNPQLREWHTKNLGRLPGLKFMRTCGSAMFRVGPSSSRPLSPVRRRLALRKLTGISGSPPQNLMRSQRSLGGPWTSPGSRNARRTKSWRPSPPTKMRSPPATPLSAAEAACVPPVYPASQSWGGDFSCAPTT